MKKIYAVTALLGSMTTLFCCVLPIVFVSLGFGAAFAGLIGAFPELTWFSEHKGWVFLIGGLLIILAGFIQLKSDQAPCPIDPKLALGCKTTKGWSYRILLLAVILYSIGFLFAFVLPTFFA